MKAKDVTISELLKGECQYRIPRYQRNYEWKKANWSDLWDDICSIHDRRADCDTSAKSRHFLGPVICRPNGEQHVIQLYDLIDGQQRLTSMLLLSKAVIDVYAGLKLVGSEVGTRPYGIRQLESIIYNHPNAPEEFRLVLMPGVADNDSILEIMALRANETCEATNLQGAYAFFKMRV